uniref:Uncharacterized protein n=1 Tax=Rhizophora mucronata TaxID=61149 RepID=A0A2P2MQ35_RHIMU
MEDIHIYYWSYFLRNLIVLPTLCLWISFHNVAHWHRGDMFVVQTVLYF